MKEVWRRTWRHALIVLNIGWELGLPIVGGTLLGHYLDRRWDTSYTYTLSLMVLGVGVGVYNVARSLQHELSRDQARPTGMAKERNGDGAREEEGDDRTL